MKFDVPLMMPAIHSMRFAASPSRSALMIGMPPPTVPMPSSPTLIGFISFQAELKLMPDVGPFGGEHAVHHGIAHSAIAPRPVVPDHPVLLGAQSFDRALRTETEVVGPQPHHLAPERFERMCEKQQLADRVHLRALAALRVPGVADLDAVGGRDDVVITGAADNLAAVQLAHGPGQHVAVPLALQRFFYIGAGLLGLGHGGEPQLPQPSVGRCAYQFILVEMGKRLELHPVTLQGDRSRPDQAAPRRSPSLRNMSRIPRTAWRRRCSFSISAMRT